MGAGLQDRVAFPDGSIIVLLLPLLLNDTAVVGLSGVAWHWQWLVDLVVYPGVLSLLLWWYTRRGWIDLRAYRLGRSNWLTDLFQATWPAFLLLAVCRLGVRRVLGVFVLPETWHFSFTIPGNEPWHLLVVVYAAVTAGFFEEIIFRGFVTARLGKLLGSPAWASLLSALLFAAVHWSQGLTGMLSALVFGLIIQAYYNSFRDMRRTIMVHVLYDLWAFW